MTRLRDYLNSLRAKFAVYEELMVLDGRGRVVASSSTKKAAVLLPQGWPKAAKAGNPIINNPIWDKTLKAGVMVIAHPIFIGRERLLGVLAAKLNFQKIVGVLEKYTLEEAGELYLITQEGAVFTTTRPISSDFLEISLGKS